MIIQRKWVSSSDLFSDFSPRVIVIKFTDSISTLAEAAAQLPEETPQLLNRLE